jgi:cell division protein FtsQ
MSESIALPTDIRLMRLVTSLLGWVLVAMVVWGLGLWAVRHPVWTLTGLTVQGDLTHQNEATVRAHMGSRLRGSFLSLDLNEAKAVFETVPWVRKALVQREFPNRIRVTLQEHQAVAWWEQEGVSYLLNRQGEVFEASADDDETDALPELGGPPGQSRAVKALFDQLVPLFAMQDLGLQKLTLTAQGSWRAGLDNDAEIELGRGSDAEVLARVRQFTATLSQVTQQHGGRSLASADLRYPAAYAIRLHGITTLAPTARMAASKR